MKTLKSVLVLSAASAAAVFAFGAPAMAATQGGHGDSVVFYSDDDKCGNTYGGLLGLGNIALFGDNYDIDNRDVHC